MTMKKVQNIIRKNQVSVSTIIGVATLILGTIDENYKRKANDEHIKDLCRQMIKENEITKHNDKYHK